MMPFIQCYVEDDTLHWLEKASAEMFRPIKELAESAIQSAAIEYKVSCMEYGKANPTPIALPQTQTKP